MVFIEHIILKNCRLCHTKPGSYDLNTDKKLIKDIYDCVKLKINDNFMQLLPHSVCEECKRTIECFSVYKQTVCKVDQCLRKILKNRDLKDSEEQFKCDLCPAEFNNHDIYKNHIHSHSVDLNVNEDNFVTEISCVKCRGSFGNLEDYGFHECSLKRESAIISDHVDEETVDIKPNCDIDEISGNRSQNVKDPKFAKYICNYKNCHKILSSAYSLKTHELKHQGKRSFLCVTCGKGFITKNSLTCHEKIHLEVKGYVCNICNIGFSVRSNLRAHEKKHHEGVRFYCSQCTKAFSSKCSLERHERIHTGIKDFKCQSCPSAFYTKKELLKHQRYHQGLRLHKCDECFKTFFERHHLIIHVRSHTGERPYVCKIPNCDKSFTESQKLKRHHNAKHAQV